LIFSSNDCSALRVCSIAENKYYESETVNKCASGYLLLNVTIGLLSKPNSVIIDYVSDTITSVACKIEASSAVSIA
jgi:hypothetical protein